MKIFIYFLFILLSTNTFAQNDKTKADLRSPYTGEEQRAIKSLSQSDIEELRLGKGWGLAKAAELNGIPGPSHLLEMSEKIELSDDQHTKIKAVFTSMQKQAISLGEKIIQLEIELNDSFANKAIDVKKLKKMTSTIGDVMSELRFVHLQAHLETLKILSGEQVQKYNTIRGYGEKDPCLEVPEGHDPELWKKHNNCSD